jgi:hypothetical protein
MTWSAIVVGVLWGAAACAYAWAHRAPPSRVRALAQASVAGEARGLSPSRWRGGVGRCAAVVEAVGGWLRKVIGLAPDRVADRRLGVAAVVLVVVAGASPVLAVPAAACAWWVPWFVARRQARVHRDDVLDALPDSLDLMRLALGGGSSLRLAVSDVAERSPPVIGARFAAVERRLSYGAPLADALDELQALGEPFRPALEAMLLAERHGAPIIPLLDRIASDARGARRRRAEELARRVPVKLLFPLVFCTLPAFGLLTVVPLLVSALGRFSI